MVDQAALERWLPEAMGRVRRMAADAAATTDEQPHLDRGGHPPELVFIVIYEGDPHEGETPVEVCMPLRPGAAPPKDAATRSIPAHREAYARVTKGIVVRGELGQVFMDSERWASEHGLEVIAAPRETYWTDFHGARDDDEVFDVAWPVR